MVGSAIDSTLSRGARISSARVRHRVSPDVLLLVTVLFWSFNFTVVKYALTHGWAPLSYSSIRFAVGGVMFSAFTYSRERSLKVQRRDVPLLVMAALLGIWLNQVTFSYAVKLTTAATVALTFGTLPIFVALIAWVVGSEKLRFRHWVAAGISFLGGGALGLGSWCWC